MTTQPEGTLWDWKAKVYIPMAEWEARIATAGPCSAACKKRPGKGHLQACRRMKALVAAGVMPPPRPRAPWGSRSRSKQDVSASKQP